MITVDPRFFPSGSLNRAQGFIMLVLATTLSSCFDQSPEPKVKPYKHSAPYAELGSGKLGFSQNDDIVVLDIDARKGQRITHSMNPVLSPDGRWVAYQTIYDPGIFLYEIESGQTKTLPPTNGAIRNPTWTADSKYLVHIEFDASWQQLVKRQVDGGARSILMPFKTSDQITYDIRVSVNDVLAFSFIESDTKTPPQTTRRGLFTLNLDGTSLTQLTVDSLFHTAAVPAWSPDGQRIALVRFNSNKNFDMSMELMLMDRNARNISTLFSSPVLDCGCNGLGPPLGKISVAWSPDGNKIAFNTFDNDGMHIYVMNVDGSALSQVTTVSKQVEGSLTWVN